MVLLTASPSSHPLPTLIRIIFQSKLLTAFDMRAHMTAEEWSSGAGRDGAVLLVAFAGLV